MQAPLNMKDVLHDALISDVASFLPEPSQAMFAVALTESWSKLSNLSRRCRLSSASRAIISRIQWQVLDFADVERELAEKLSDHDIHAILTCINAKYCLRKLKLARCFGIVGHGLEPIRGSTVIEQIDLSFASKHETMQDLPCDPKWQFYPSFMILFPRATH